jgi:hypothetical protein
LALPVEDIVEFLLVIVSVNPRMSKIFFVQGRMPRLEHGGRHCYQGVKTDSYLDACAAGLPLFTADNSRLLS